MNNQVFGIATILFCSIGFFLSWRCHKNEQYNLCITLLLIGGLLLRVFCSCDFFLHDWDERFHALVAKNLVQHPLTPTLYNNPVLPYDYTNWAGNHIWLHKQPLSLWTMAASMWLFGINEIALRIPSITLSTLGIFLIYYIAEYIAGKKAAFISAFLYSINGLIIELTSGRVATDHVDMFFLFFILLAIFLSVKFIKSNYIVYTILIGISIGAAILSKWLPALIVIPVWLLLLIDSRKFSFRCIAFHFLVLSVTCCIVFVPWQLYIHQLFPMESNWESSLNLKHLTRVLDGRGGPFYYYVNKIRINYGELIYLPVLWFFWQAAINSRNYKQLAISIWFLIPFIFFSFAKTKMQGYLAFTSPALFIMTAVFWNALFEITTSNRIKKTFIKMLLVLLLVLPTRYSIERIKPFEKTNRTPQWVVELKALNKEKIRNGILFNYNKPVEAMFYTDIIVYGNIPTVNEIFVLQKKGYTVMINSSNELPEKIKNLTGVIYEKLSN